jgi:predicted ATPase
VAELLRQDCQVTDADPPDAVAAKLSQRLDALGLAAKEMRPYLLRVLGVELEMERLARLNPDAIRLDTLEHLRRLTLTWSRTEPLVLAMEDLHWIDTASEAYVASLTDMLAAAPILLVVTYRPGYQPATSSRPTGCWSGPTAWSRIPPPAIG